MTNNETPQQTATLTIDQALQQAIAHHHSGQLQDAERLYRAILQAQPSHPDANHNLGVLAVQVRMPAAALPYLKSALEANPNQGQYWLSYIDAQIQAGQIDAARQALDQGMQRGLNGDAVEVLAKSLEANTRDEEQSNAQSQHVSRQALPDSSAIVKQNRNVCKTEPIKKSVRKLSSREKNPSPKEINKLVSLFAAGRYAEVLSQAQLMTARFSQNGIGWKAMGVAFCEMGRSEDAIAPLQKAAELLPRDAEVHYNLGNALKNEGRIEEAETCYRISLRLNPNSAVAHNNLGLILHELERSDEAEESFRRAIKIMPAYAEAYYHLGNILKENARFDESLASYQSAVRIKPNLTEALHNLGDTFRIMDDLEHAAAAYQKALDVDPAGLGLEPGVNLAVLYFLAGKILLCKEKLAVTQPIMGMTDANKINLQSYWHYLNNLVSLLQQSNQNSSQTQIQEALNVIGESHALASHSVVVKHQGKESRCSAEWIEGCKQWHLGNSKPNKYKYKFEAVMARLPRQSTILLTIGEIDCRPDEGIIKAWRKSPDKSLEEIAKETVCAYVKYVSDISARHDHQLIISGVPAPNIKMDAMAADEKRQFVQLIRSFNRILKEQALSAGMSFLDVYALTDRGDGIASGQWHIDDYHLLPNATVEAFAKHCIQPSVPQQAPAPSHQELHTLVSLLIGGR